MDILPNKEPPAMDEALLTDLRFHQLLLGFDQDLARSACAQGCPYCLGGTALGPLLAQAPRPPRGLGEEYRQRFSFCCAVKECRKRKTPTSLRFLGPKVYGATIIVLQSVLRGGAKAAPHAPTARTDRRKSAHGHALAALVARDVCEHRPLASHPRSAARARGDGRVAGLALGALRRQRREPTPVVASLSRAAHRRRRGTRYVMGDDRPQRMPVANRRAVHYGARHGDLEHGAGMTRGDGSRIHERWAELRFSVIGHLLAAPPAPGMLRGELQKLAPARVAPSEYRRASALRCLDDRTMAVPRPTRTARSGRCLEAQATQRRRQPRLAERGGARGASSAIRRPSEPVGATTRR